MNTLADLERIVVETAITAHCAWIEHHGNVRGGEETVDAWYARSGPARIRWIEAHGNLDRAVEQLLWARTGARQMSGNT